MNYDGLELYVCILIITVMSPLYHCFITVISCSCHFRKDDNNQNCSSLFIRMNCLEPEPYLVLVLVLQWDCCFLHANTSNLFLWSHNADNATTVRSMAEDLDLRSKASLDSALQSETIWIRSQISASGRQRNGHQRKDHKANK